MQNVDVKLYGANCDNADEIYYVKNTNLISACLFCQMYIQLNCKHLNESLNFITFQLIIHHLSVNRNSPALGPGRNWFFWKCYYMTKYYEFVSFEFFYRFIEIGFPKIFPIEPQTISNWNAAMPDVRGTCDQCDMSAIVIENTNKK